MANSSRTERLASIVKAYDIRGLSPEQLDADLAWRLGAAVATFMVEDDPAVSRLLLGRDMRPTGVELTEAFGRGARSTGLNVIDLGLISTDELYFASGHFDAAGAVFTASHNPAGYNGIKICRRGAAPIGQDTGLAAIRDLAAVIEPGEPTGSLESLDVLADFADHVRSFVDLDALRPLKVVADSANGMGGLVVPAVFVTLPFELDHMYPELDGTFPNHEANPLQAENLRDLQARVRELGADIGLAFDGDADRVFIVDDQAAPVSGSLTTAMVASSILDKNPGATVLHNLICSKTVPEVVAEKGGTAIRTRVGHSFIKQRMAETGAAFAGEHSGHYYFADNYRADSGLITALIVLELLSNAAVPLSELRRPFDRYAASGEINTKVDDPLAVIESVAAHFQAISGDASVDRLDGLTVDLGDWWFNLRPSNTEPLLRLNLEAPDAASCAARVAEVQSAMGSD